MDTIKLDQMRLKKGFIAALDQSGGSTPKALALYGVKKEAYNSDDEMFELVHQMRTRIIKSKSFTKDKIVGAILFEKTMDDKIDGIYTADYLYDKKGILPFLKIDKGLEELKDGVQLMKPIVGLEELLTKANKRNIFGTKMRSVIKEFNEKGIKEVVNQQFEIAKEVLKFGLIPIIEPEVDINMENKKETEELLLKYLVHYLDKLNDNVIFKLTIPSEENLYLPLINDKRVVRVVALSGGYSRDKANELLSKNTKLIASFSRAFTEGLSVNQTDDEFDEVMRKSIDSIYKASL